MTPGERLTRKNFSEAQIERMVDRICARVRVLRRADAAAKFVRTAKRKAHRKGGRRGE